MKDGPKRPRRRRDLSPEERALWDKVAESVRPLPGRKKKPAAEAGPAAPMKPVTRTALLASAAPRAEPRKPPPLAPLEPKLARSLKKGAAVDARLDLHGLYQDQAHGRLLRFLKTQQGRGSRVVLVITGKGKSGEERGVLRRMVPIWLAEPALRETVIGFSEASAAHGGAGALYVRLRRERG